MVWYVRVCSGSYLAVWSICTMFEDATMLPTDAVCSIPYRSSLPPCKSLLHWRGPAVVLRTPPRFGNISTRAIRGSLGCHATIVHLCIVPAVDHAGARAWVDG